MCSAKLQQQIKPLRDKWKASVRKIAGTCTTQRPLSATLLMLPSHATPQGTQFRKSPKYHQIGVLGSAHRGVRLILLRILSICLCVLPTTCNFRRVLLAEDAPAIQAFSGNPPHCRLRQTMPCRVAIENGDAQRGGLNKACWI